ncbi:MAG: DUF4157 domain-containing protein, partial [Spirochaetales bacterium]|nr:DUF4157 domain-containing protein [Spirochaetales bacterium]
SFGDFISDTGNLKMQNFFESRMVQAKLNVSQQGDMYENEADRIAKAIVNGKPTQKPHVNTVMTKTHSHNITVNNNTEFKIKALKGKGNPLSRPVRDSFEPRFGVDLGNVRVHTDGNANLLAQSINARAFTHGNDIVFDKGEYNPETTGGKKLLAHELTHTIRQNKNTKNKELNRKIDQKK